MAAAVAVMRSVSAVVVIVVSIHVANVRPADIGVHDVDLDTFHSWFTTTADLSHTDEDSTSSLQSPVHGTAVYPGNYSILYSLLFYLYLKCSTVKFGNF